MMITWWSFDWDAWENGIEFHVRADIRDAINDHREHAIREFIGTFGVEIVECETCGKTLWDWEEDGIHGWN